MKNEEHNFLTGKEKADNFEKEFKELLVRYGAELSLEDYGSNWLRDERMVVNFSWDEVLAERTNDGYVPEWVIGSYENGI